MDLNQILDRAPKRQRTNEEGDDQVQRNYSPWPPTRSQSNHNFPSTSIQGQEKYGISSDSGVTSAPNWNPNHVSSYIDTINNHHIHDLRNSPSQFVSSYQFSHHLSSPVDPSQRIWQVPPGPATTAWPFGYTGLPSHDALSHAHVSNYTSFNFQSFLPRCWPDQSTTNLQQWPDSSVRQTLPSTWQDDSSPPIAEQLDLHTEKQAKLEKLPHETVCFGMILGIAAHCERRGMTQSIPTTFPVNLESSNRFTSKDTSEITGRIMSEYGQVIQGLLDETSLDLHVSCVVDSQQASESQKAPRGLSTVPCALELTLYGPLDLFEELGSWFEDYQIFLQDPRECHRYVRYCNPHRLSSQDFSSALLLSEVIAQSARTLQLETISQQPDLLGDLNSHEDLEEAFQPAAIKRELRRHQKQALTFMLRREMGWKYGGDLGLWETADTDRGRFFLNRVSNASQAEQPAQCYGGIIADPMGLGKTLTMIALAATDLESSGPDIDDEEDCYIDNPATLIVVPPPLIGTWEEQLAEHVVDGALAYRRHHRDDRLTSLDDLEGFNIILTTYHTISSEWNNSNISNNSLVFSVRWKRIILDEAHLIRNSNSRMSQAICALEARSRWAVTGTPLQNRLGDLATLFKFIRAHPYTDKRCFDADISLLWKAGQYEEAINRLKRLCKCLLLRRDKGTVTLPSRQDLQCPVDLNTEERALYNRLRDSTLASINEALTDDVDSSKSGAYANVLQQIESLRLVCNLGLHYNSRHAKPQYVPTDKAWASVAQRTFNMQREMGAMVCLKCSSTLDITEAELEDSTTTSQNPFFFESCSHSPCCAIASVSTGGQALESSLSDVQPQADRELPSKIVTLITDIKTLPPGEKCIVFSTWRLTLDLVETGLNQSSIPSVRFDGKVPQKDRQHVVDRFRQDPSVRVMLLTLSCGAAGLTLTVATRAYLMEPHWNPTLEEQALARIHRIGQAREVTTQVIKVQESKKYLAGLLLSPQDNGNPSENLSRLQELISLI
ncbi:alpha-1,6-mannosyltransferase subunit [Fusarium longipes]|uniref:Alpha-1,6-mannosyltransferase subunit n=1 Tax=Fusarium longipes TaxID=694270 RepID=A0A395SA70_9HYPO|nr:alpha-1,6-mannosyltransferase subunit [Fusarium longipes]